MTFRSAAVWRRWCSGRRRAWMWGRAALCTRGRRPAREPSAPRASGSARRLGARPGPAPAHRPRSPPPPPPTAAWTSGPSGALRTCGAWCAGVWLGASARCPVRPRHRPRAPQPVPPAPSTPVGPGRCVWYPGVCRGGSLCGARPQPHNAPLPEPHPNSHVLTPRPFQTMNPQRWNCNVFRLD